jgi:alkanesulfonate monooxygenase SsuD/methylene tetrahydromethanopterin reductase-like flavin-dependent oxidoreductase (luciferase family)
MWISAPRFQRGRMRIGAFLLGPGVPGLDHATVLDTTVAAAVAAESAGFDEVWVAEHHFMSYGLVPSAVTLAGYLLGATRRVVVGTAVSVLSTGTPDDAVAALAATAARTGIRHLLLMVEGAGDRRRTCENIARLGAEVLPRLRAS